MASRSLASLLESSTVKHPERVALVLGDTRLSYAQVDGAADQVANLLVSRGIGPGDKAALSCANLPWFTIVYFGILKAGATVVPLNILLKGGEVAYHLGDSDAKAYVCFQGTPELPIGQEGYAGFGEDEGCEHFFMITVDPAAESPIEGTETLARAMAGQPMYWGLLGALDQAGVAPQQLAAQLRVAVAGGSALPVEVHKEFERRFGVTILEGYGLSETSPVASFAPWGDDVRVGSIGKPIPGVERKLIEDDWSDALEGEVARSPSRART